MVANRLNQIRKCWGRGVEDVSQLDLYLHDGRQWLLACGADGSVAAGGEGCIVPGSRINHNAGHNGNDTPAIEIRVYRYTGFQAASANNSGSGGGGCFINTLGF